DPRPGPFAFQAFNKTGFLTADISACTTMNVDVQMKILPENVPTQQIGCISLVDCSLHRAATAPVLVADIDVSRARMGCVASEDNPFKHLVRVFFHEDTVVEGARLAFIGVDA